MDHISVTKLPKPGGMQKGWPQPYELTVAPTGGGKRPELDFLHKGDGITVDDVAYIVDFAQQVRSENAQSRWTWVYRVTVMPTDDEEERPW